MQLKDNHCLDTNVAIEDSVFEILIEINKEEFMNKKRNPLRDYFLALNYLIKGDKIHV